MITTQDILKLKSALAEIAIICRGEWPAWEAIYGDISLFVDLLDSAETLENVSGFLEYLATGGNIKPIVRELEESLGDFLDGTAIRVSEYAPLLLADHAREWITEYLAEGGTADEIRQGVFSDLEEIIDLCSEWVRWIQLYFPGRDAAARPGAAASCREKPGTRDGAQLLPRSATGAQQKPTAAAKRLASMKFQELKKDLIKAGLIVAGKWEGTPAEYGELVRHLKEDCGVENRGGYAWNDCRLFAGYHGSDKSAQNAIISNQGDVRGDRAEAIRRICQRHKVR